MKDTPIVLPDEVTAGTVIELGMHDELIERRGRYAGFYAERSRAAGWRITSGPRS